jgi:hypothetical protein
MRPREVGELVVDDGAEHCRTWMYVNAPPVLSTISLQLSVYSLAGIALYKKELLRNTE